MVKSTICFVISVICITVGAFIINEGFGMIVTGAWFLVGSYVEYTKEEETEEGTKVWHDLTETPPPKSGVILLRESTHNLIGSLKIGYWSAPQNKFRDQQDVFYYWPFINNELIYDQWCYLDDIIKSQENA